LKKTESKVDTDKMTETDRRRDMETTTEIICRDGIEKGNMNENFNC